MSRSALMSAVVLAVLTFGMLPISSPSGLIGPPLAHAQNFGNRVVRGTVLDAKSQPLAGAIVFLQNQKTKTIRSYTSDPQGHFNFAQVDMTQDFNIWAEKGDKKSATKIVSSWDARKDFVIDLKIK